MGATPNPGAAYVAYREGNHWKTQDGEAFIEAAPAVITFLNSCGPAHRLSASDLALASSDIRHALEVRRGNAHRARGD